MNDEPKQPKQPKAVHPRRLITHAVAVGMECPSAKDFDIEDCDITFPRFYLFCRLNLGRANESFAELRKNARAVNEMPIESVRRMIEGLT